MDAVLEPGREFVQEVALRGVQRLHLEQAAMVLGRDGEATAEALKVGEREFHASPLRIFPILTCSAFKSFMSVTGKTWPSESCQCSDHLPESSLHQIAQMAPVD